jgi:hypothetical protein
VIATNITIQQQWPQYHLPTPKSRIVCIWALNLICPWQGAHCHCLIEFAIRVNFFFNFPAVLCRACGCFRAGVNAWWYVTLYSPAMSCRACIFFLSRRQCLLISNTLLFSFLYFKTTMCCGLSSTNAACAAVRCLLINLPDPLNKRWYSTSDLHKFVTNGGFPKILTTLVAKTLRGMQAIPSFKRDKTKTKHSTVLT